MQGWGAANEWESSWWGDCCNTFQEELKQTVYARLMKIDYDLRGSSVLDIGGGPISLLLKCRNRGNCYVVDPLKVPEWVKQRYRENNIIFASRKGEELQNHPKVDETWIYNVLQHTENPELVIQNARKCSKIIRIFEWIEEPISDGHIHTLHEEELNKWLGGYGKTYQLNENGCHGLAYAGIFKGDLYE